MSRLEDKIPKGPAKEGLPVSGEKQARYSGKCEPRGVVILTDGIRGHENQSLGIASWLEDLGAVVDVFKIPALSGFSRFKSLKLASRRLMHKRPVRCMKWLAASGGEGLLEEIKSSLQRAGIDAKDVLFLSAGSSAAPYCLAVGRILGGKCCTVMTPSVLGTEPFDFAVIPEHDQPEPADNVLVTLGAPNKVRPGLLEKEEAELKKRNPPKRQTRWAILLGGDDKNYHIGPERAQRLAEVVLGAARDAAADVYITTSRRTLPETEKALEETARGEQNVRMLLLASEDPWNPVPGMLGLCDRVICTEDSVSMISEAATAGRRPVVLRVERKKAPAAWAAKAAALFAEKEFFSERHIFGVPRFDRMIGFFERRNLCRYLENMDGLAETLRGDGSAPPLDFNEARRAAEWIIRRWCK